MNIIPFILLAGFITLAVYSYPEQTGYSANDIMSVNELAVNGEDYLTELQHSWLYKPAKHRH